MGIIGGILSGAATAAMYGAKGAWTVGKAIATPATRVAFAAGTPAAKGVLTLAGRTAGWSLRNPELALGLGIAGVGVYAGMRMGAGESTLNEKQVNRLAMRTGPSTGFSPGMGSLAYDPNRMAFIDSTNDLVQGLHRARRG